MAGSHLRTDERVKPSQPGRPLPEVLRRLDLGVPEKFGRMIPMQMARSISLRCVTAALVCAVGAILALSAPIARAASPGSHNLRPGAIVAGRFIAPDGTIKENVAIVLADGKVKNVISADDLRNIDSVQRYPDGVVSAGLIDVRSSVSAYGQTGESAYAVDPGVSAVDSIDPYHRDFRRTLKAGITTVVVTPAPNNLVCGAAAAMKTHVDDGGVTWLRDDGPLVLALGPTVWEHDREPTSRMGSVAMLRHILEQAAQGDGHRRIHAFAGGSLDGMVICGGSADVSAALRTLRNTKARYAIVYDGDEHGLAEELSGGDVPVVLGPLDFASSRRALEMAAVLAALQVPVAFTARTPAGAGEALRVSAALAVRYGLDPAVARRAITAVPARVAGVADRVGEIRSGLDADIVVFSDDPLRLDAAVTAVYVDGRRVYWDGQAESSSPGDPL